MTTAVDLNEQINQLRHLAHHFKALHNRVRALDIAAVAPGTEALRQLTPLVLTSQELVGKALLPLSALDGSPYAAVSGSRQALNALGAVVSGASQASCDLAHALAANPLDSIGFGGPHQDEEGIRNARHARAVPEMAGHLADAAHQLNVCESACHDLATYITRDLERASTNTRQAPKISPTQYEALTSLAKCGATMQTRGRGSTIVLTPDHTLITIATFQSLDKRGLVHLDTSVPLYQGRGITVTAEGHRALAQHRARTGATTGPTAATATMPPAAVKREVRR
ncbi:hypothetical protein Scani_00040 [Streptomyces caniferus]|uniref:Uncharacterized protein n=1 Tax=Streptomyces caniferus TaxID=285557 RepID=A0A640RZY4_9ACTN|nr:hypothetical protein [Streptomyces caniferus]GFE03736.1 hypothetical protein Scani_00040 [Streptomyces caniferus]